MDLALTEAETVFRDEFRGWLEVNPPGPALLAERESFEHRRAFDRKLYAGGWAGVHWPVEYGGRGATLVESAIYYEELARIAAPATANPIGLTLAGPTLMVHGSEEQKERFLPPILAGEEIWCQGFSEPGGGSDLAAVQTRATKVDGGWRINGQKVWTSFAHDAQWCLLVARSDLDRPRHRGLSYFLLDMNQPQVRVRRIKQITGFAEFNEVFFNDAFVPDDRLVDTPGNGWQVAMTTLSNERSGLVFGKSFQAKMLLDRLTGLADERGLLGDATVAVRLGQLHAQVEAVRLTAYRNITTEMQTGNPGPEGAIIKWIWSEGDQAITEFAAELLGAEALDANSIWGLELLRSRGDTIESGTTEIIKNITAERVLGLPRLR